MSSQVSRIKNTRSKRWGSTVTIYRSIYQGYRNSIFRSDFRPILMYMCRVSFLITLNIYKAYFRGCHKREYKENICKRWPMPYSLKKKLLRLCALGFCNQVLLDLHCWWSEELCSQYLLLVGDWSRVLGSTQLVSHVLGFVHQKGGVHRSWLQNSSLHQQWKLRST